MSPLNWFLYNPLPEVQESFTYQWQNSLDNSTWSNITGAISESFQPPALTVKKYYKRLTTDGSCGTIETNVINN